MESDKSDNLVTPEAAERFLWEHPRQIEVSKQGDGREVLTPNGEVKV